MAGTPLKNLRMFKKLCGENALRNIILMTTMWDEVDEETGAQREKELKGKYWNTMIEQKSKTARYLGTSDSAWDIVDHFLQSSNERCAVLLQREMVDMERQLRETKAGQTLYTTLELIVDKQQQTLKKMREQTKEHADEKVLNVLKAEYEELRKSLAVTVEEMQTLKLPLGKRVLNIVRSPLNFMGLRHGTSCLLSGSCHKSDRCED
jgi:ribosome-associated translation inhibitor RaiA